jgi:hypothetical protein
MDPYFIDEELSDLEDDTKPMTEERVEKKERRFRHEMYEILRGNKALDMKGTLACLKEERRLKRMRI